MTIQSNRLKQIESPFEAAARHPYILLLLIFYVVAGAAAGISVAFTAASRSPSAELSLFFEALPQGRYHMLPAVARSAALNVLLYFTAMLPRLWRPLLLIGGLSVSIKSFFMGLALRFLFLEMGIRGLALGTPLCVLPALFCMAALALRMLADLRQRSGLDAGGLSARSIGLIAVCILLESAAAPVALRAWLK